MNRNNPYSKIFGKIPAENITRSSVIDKIYGEFNCENPESSIYVLTGIRGSGKTVTLTEIVNAAQKNRGWICIEINSSARDMLKTLAAQLYAQKPIFNLLARAKVNFSVLGLGVEFNGEPPIMDYATAVEMMLKSSKDLGMKVLVTIDELTTTDASKEFIKQFQIYLRHDLPIFLVATGLNKDFEKMRNSDGMTFLYRAPKINLDPLDKIAIADSYEKNLDVSRAIAISMAKFSLGYSFGFQIIGYICSESKLPFDDPAVLKQFDHEMYEKVYSKVWSETTKQEKEYLNAIALAKSSKIEDIRKVLDVDNNHFNPVRRKLLDQGLVVSPNNGYLAFSLPRFGEFVKEMYLMEN